MPKTIYTDIFLKNIAKKLSQVFKDTEMVI